MTDYRVDVVASSVADVVRGAGGWIYDHSMQGWTVNVVIRQPGDARPIEILGASVNSPKNAGHSERQVFLDMAAGGEVIEHRLSAAARLFKAQALIAAQLVSTLEVREILFVRAPSAAVASEASEPEHVTAVSPS
ncbi:MAG: hypothetical protein ACXVJ3_03800 [Ilumatobacteraceae bacterium]